MARSLGGVTLPAGSSGSSGEGSIEWTDEHDWSAVAQATQRTLGGALVVYEAALTAGQPMTLEARDGVCWLSLATVQALRALAASAGGSLTLVWDAASYRVVFDRTRGQPLEFAPIRPHAALFTGRIHLLSV